MPPLAHPPSHPLGHRGNYRGRGARRSGVVPGGVGDYTGQQAYGGDKVPYGYMWTSDSGNFSCDSASDGITCTNQSGDGFFLNHDDYSVITP